jgi:cytochrome c-type biogenesis protein CcmH/NrfF
MLGDKDGVKVACWKCGNEGIIASNSEEARELWNKESKK